MNDIDRELDELEDVRGWLDDALHWLLDSWLQKLGIVFLLIGVGFLFKYSYDNGLLIPPLRVLAGLGVGGALGVFGWRLRAERRALSHVLMGGASATFYITLYAAAQLYELIPQVAALALMMGVTMATFVVATRENGRALAIVATLGGFATPFFLDASAIFGTQHGDLGTLIYMCTVLAGATAIYAMRGWNSLLLTTNLAIWAYLGMLVMGAETTLELAATQIGIVLAFCAAAIVPLLRFVLTREDRGAEVAWIINALALVAPMMAMLFTRSLWDLGDSTWGLLELMIALGYLGGAMALDGHEDGDAIAPVHALVAAGFLTLGLTDILSGPVLMVGLIVEGVALCWLGHRGVAQRGWTPGPTILMIVGYLLLGWTLIDSLLLLVGAILGATAFPGAEGIQLVAMSAAIAVVGQFHREDSIRFGFEWTAHLMFLATVLHQCIDWAHGDVISTAIWGGYSIALLAFGLARRGGNIQWMGLAGVLLAALKLLFVDMHGAETLWRVLLFLVFGAALLGLSYWAPGRLGSEPSRV